MENRRSMFAGQEPSLQIHATPLRKTADSVQNNPLGLKPSIFLCPDNRFPSTTTMNHVGKLPRVATSLEPAAPQASVFMAGHHGTNRDDLIGSKPSVLLLQHVSTHGTNHDDLVGSKPTVQLLQHASRHGNNNSSYVGETENQPGSIIRGRGSTGLSHPNSNQCIRIQNSVTRDNNSYTSDQSMMPQSYYGVSSADFYVRNDDTEPTSVQDALISLAQNAGSSLLQDFGRAPKQIKFPCLT